ncbi:hypothetical protein HY970_02700 [Candidatus Kaiserbacteria bacterium]|nr:hypothetical protein [Candidatus Kaiserbacteria bacterium]
MAHGGHGLLYEWTDLDEWVEWMGDWGLSRALMLWLLYIGLFFVLSEMVPNLWLFTFNWMVGTAPIWLPAALWIAGWMTWVWYIQSLYLSGRKPILLEVKMPREITKSPRAMELVYTAFNLSSGETTFIHRGWKGQVRPFFSFEIASFGGEIHFYIWCWNNYKNTVEGTMYAQYPEVEIVEVEDYASKFQFDPDKHNCWGVEWPLMSYIKGLNWTFKINAYPIRTYVDFELDKDPKEEFKVDPLAQVLEFMSNIKPYEQLWIQIIIRKCGKIGGILKTQEQDNLWKDMVEKEVNKLRAQSATVPKDVAEAVLEDMGESVDDPSPIRGQARPSWKHQQMIQSMERNLGKYPFEVGTRGIYWTEKELHGPTFTGFRWIWRAFGNPQYATHLRPRRWHCDFDYPWQDFHGLRWTNQTRRVHDAYRRRLFYHSPWILPTNILTNEVLASIWRPISSTIKTPGIERIPATKAEPPANLPR